MAVVVIFGLVVATFLTLVVVPTLYFMLERSKERMVKGNEWFDRLRWGKIYQGLAGESGKMLKKNY